MAAGKLKRRAQAATAGALKMSNATNATARAKFKKTTMPMPNAATIKLVHPSFDRAVLSRSRISQGRIVWAWRRLTPAQRKRVDSETRAESLNLELLDKILEARTLANGAKKR